jgi:hypothetical protein
VALGYHTFSLYKSFLLDTVNVQKSDTLSVVAHVPLFFRSLSIVSQGCVGKIEEFTAKDWTMLLLSLQDGLQLYPEHDVLDKGR